MSHLDPFQSIFLAIYIFQIVFLVLNSLISRKYLSLGTFESVILPASVVLILVSRLTFVSTDQTFLEILGAVLFISGSLFGAYAFQHLTFTNSDDFWFSRTQNKKRSFVTTGPYATIRHPMFTSLGLQYLGLVLIFLHPLTLLFWFIALIYALYTSAAEEKYMKKLFPEYARYEQKTKRFIPFVY